MPDKIAESALRKVRWRLIPFLFLLYIVAYLDRVNVGFAAHRHEPRPRLQRRGLRIGVGDLFPQLHAARSTKQPDAGARFGARVWIARIMVTWGVLSSAMMFVDSPAQLLRPPLPARRGGGGILPRRHPLPDVLVPATRARPRGRAAVHDGDGDGRRDRRADLELAVVPGWRDGTAWMAVDVPDRRPAGDPPRARGPALHDRETVRCEMADRAEREWLSREMAAEQADTGHAIVTLRGALGSARLWIVSLPYFCIVIAFYGISFWLPQILQSVSGFGSATVVLLSAIPYVAATVGLVVIGGRSDRVRRAALARRRPLPDRRGRFRAHRARSRHACVCARRRCRSRRSASGARSARSGRCRPRSCAARRPRAALRWSIRSAMSAASSARF